MVIRSDTGYFTFKSCRNLLVNRYPVSKRRYIEIIADIFENRRYIRRIADIFYQILDGVFQDANINNM